MAGLKFDITGNANGYIAATRQAEAATGRLVGTLNEEGKKVDDLFKKLATSAGAVFTLQMASQFSKQVAKVRGEFQQLEVAFETMLQSKEKADALMAQVVETAATTPFDLHGVANGAKQLLAYGVASEQVNDTLIRLGDIAAGLSIPLNDLVYLYGTTMVQGRLFTQDLRQFQGRGIPLADELAKQFRVAKDAVGELVTAGKVGFPEVEKAIMSMTSEGGKFGGLMEKQSKTITGQISNLEDAIDQMFNEIGKSQEDVISGAIGLASNLVENYEKVGTIIGGIVVAYGSYKAALIALNAITKASIALDTASAVAKRLSAKATKEVTVATLLFAKAQKALSASMLANPYVLAAAAIAALGVGIYALVTAKSKEERAFERVNEQIERYDENLSKQKQHLQELFDKLNSSESTDMQRALAMEQLRELYPAILKDLSDEELLKMSAAEATKRLTEENEKLIRQDLAAQITRASQGYEEAMKKILEYKNKSRDAVVKSYEKDSGYIQATKDADRYRYELEALLNAYNDIEDAAKKADFLALPAEQKVVSLKESNEQLDADIKLLDIKLKELKEKKDSIGIMEPEEFKIGSLGGALYEGGMTEEQLVAEIERLQAQKKANEKDIAENQAKIDANNKALSDKQKKAAYDRRKAEQKAAEDLARMKQDLNNKIAQADINSLEDGYAKSMRQLKHNHDLELQEIERQKRELLKRKKEEALQSWLAEDPENRKAYDFKYVATLTSEEEEMFRQAGEFAQKEFNKGREQAFKKWEKESGFFTRQLAIDAMAEGSEKDEAQRELDNEKELHNLELQRNAYLEAAEAAHIFAENKKKIADLDYVIEPFDVDQANADFEQIVADTTARQNKDKSQAEREAWKNYYIEYGNYKEKVLHLTEQYNDRIAKAATAGEKASLTAERDKVLKELEQAQNKAWQNIFKDPTKMSLSSVRDAIKLAQSEIKKITSKGVLNDQDTERLKALQEAVDNLQEYENSAPFAGFGDGLDGVVSKFNSILAIRKRINEAEKTGNAQAKADAEDELVATQNVLKKNLAGVGVDSFAKGLTIAADAMEKIADISGDPQLKQTAEILNGTANVITATAIGAAAGGWIGALVGGLTSILGEVVNAIVGSEAAFAANQKAMEDYGHSLKGLALSIDEDVYDTIFGESVWTKIEHMQEMLERAKQKYDEYVKASAKYMNVTSKIAPDGTIIEMGVETGLRSIGNALIQAKGKNKKKYSGTLNTIFPDLFDEQGKLKMDKIEEAKEALKTLQSMELKKDEGVGLLKNAIELAEKVEEHTEKLKDAAKDYLGTVGASLGDSIVDSILRGEDALESFADSAGSIIEQIARDFAASWMIENYLSNFQEDMQNAFLKGNAKEVTDIVGSIVEGLPAVLEAGQNAAKEILDMTVGTDYDLYKKYAESNRSSSSKGIAQASQSSIDELNGMMTNIQSHTFSINQHLASVVSINTQILSAVRGIESNTDRLAEIESNLTLLEGIMSDIVTKGLKIRA